MTRLGGVAITVLWLLLSGAILVEMVGLAGVGIAAGETRLPVLLVVAIVAASLVALAPFRREIAIAVAIGGGFLTAATAATLASWHPDYWPILESGGALSGLSCVWAVLTLARAKRANAKVRTRG